MTVALNILAFVLFGIGLVVSIVFLLSPDTGSYPYWALFPNLAGVILMIPIIRRSRRDRESR